MRVKNPINSFARIVFQKVPVEAQLIVTRRCNLSCGYCSEYDNHSPPVPLAIIKERIDALHRLKVIHISLLGGEPLLHPQIADIVAYANRHSQVSITTNGFLLSEKLIRALNEAGLSNMQISVDALAGDDSGYIQKSFKSVAPKLKRLKSLADFGINVNVVLCRETIEQFAPMVRLLKEMELSMSVGLLHDSAGHVMVSGEELLALWDYYFRESKTIAFIEYEYGRRLLSKELPDWQCRAGSRYLYVDEFGMVQYCSAQRGRLNKPITEYDWSDIQAQGATYKGCESGCALFCVYRSSQVDNAPLRTAQAFYKIARSAKLVFSDTPISA